MVVGTGEDEMQGVMLHDDDIFACSVLCVVSGCETFYFSLLP